MQRSVLRGFGRELGLSTFGRLLSIPRRPKPLHSYPTQLVCLLIHRYPGTPVPCCCFRWHHPVPSCCRAVLAGTPAPAPAADASKAAAPQLRPFGGLGVSLRPGGGNRLPGLRTRVGGSAFDGSVRLLPGPKPCASLGRPLSKAHVRSPAAVHPASEASALAVFPRPLT